MNPDIYSCCITSHYIFKLFMETKQTEVSNLNFCTMYSFSVQFIGPIKPSQKF